MVHWTKRSCESLPFDVCAEALVALITLILYENQDNGDLGEIGESSMTGDDNNLYVYKSH